MLEVATTKKWGGARVAEWARLLSECWVKPVAGSNPALPATEKRVPQGRVFVLSRVSSQEDDVRILPSSPRRKYAHLWAYFLFSSLMLYPLIPVPRLFNNYPLNIASFVPMGKPYYHALHPCLFFINPLSGN